MFKQVSINGEEFEVFVKTHIANDYVDFNYLRVKVDNIWYKVESITLRDLFWNRYLGSVRTQLREEKK